MSEKELISKKLGLFIIINVAVTFFLGLLLLLLGLNETFCEYFYDNDVTFAIFRVITELGDETIFILVIVTAWYVYDVTFAKNLAFSLLGSYYVNSVLKDIFQDPRPWTAIKAGATGFGFPSGHSQQAVATYSYIGYEAYQKDRKYIAWIFVFLTYLVAISRVIIGVHDVQDIWGGLLIGAIWLIIFIILEPKVSRVVSGLNFLFKILLSLIIPIILFTIAVFLFPLTELDYGLICGAMMGLSMGYLVGNEKIGYNPKNFSSKQKALNFVIGIVFTLILYLGLSFIPLDNLGQIWDFIQYFILSLILTTFIPWLFLKIQR